MTTRSMGWRWFTHRAHRSLLTLIATFACRGSLSPLSNRLEVGQEPYFVFVADGEAGVGDLFASKPAGGAVYQITYTRVDERLPALSPDGTMLAFLRARAPGSATRQALVVMNLLNGAEQRLDLEAPFPGRMAWSRDGRKLYLRAGDSLLGTPAPPAPFALGLVPDAERPTADSLLSVLLGDPPLAAAVPCDSTGVCARFGDGTRQVIAAAATEPTRWMGDSILYREAGEWVIRPLAGGRPRVLRASRGLGQWRSLTVFGGPRQGGN
jgi:WD40-like Beta Propeller Repeat